MTKGSNRSQLIYEIRNEPSELKLLKSYNEYKSKWNPAFQILREKYFQPRIPSICNPSVQGSTKYQHREVFSETQISKLLGGKNQVGLRLLQYQI